MCEKPKTKKRGKIIEKNKKKNEMELMFINVVRCGVFSRAIKSICFIWPTFKCKYTYYFYLTFFFTPKKNKPVMRFGLICYRRKSPITLLW